MTFMKSMIQIRNRYTYSPGQKMAKKIGSLTHFCLFYNTYFYICVLNGDNLAEY